MRVINGKLHGDLRYFQHMRVGQVLTFASVHLDMLYLKINEFQRNICARFKQNSKYYLHRKYST